MRFADLLAEVRRAYDIEKNAKNEAYAFIVLNGHLEAYEKWRADEAPADPWAAIIAYLDSLADDVCPR